MSDDLERAVAGFLEARRNGADQTWPAIVRAALLSFLDMDEAGVERIARAIWLDAFAEKIGSPERARYLWDCAEIDGGRDPTQFAAIDSARAVLSELRKMAGEK